MRTLISYLTCVVSLLTLSVVVSDGDVSRLDHLRRQARQLTEKNVEELVGILSSTEFPNLSDVGLTECLSPIGCSACLEILWARAGISEPMSLDPVNVANVKITQDTASECLKAGHAYELLLTKSPQKTLAWMESRASSPATLLDVLVVGRVLWGKAFSAVPQGEPTPIPFEATPNSPSEWKIPFTPPVWKMLYEGKNAAYRMLAVRAIDNWGKEGDKDDFINRGASDTIYEMRRMWLFRLSRLPAEKQAEVLERAIAKRPVVAIADKYRKEAEEHFYLELQRHLRKAKQASRGRKGPHK